MSLASLRIKNFQAHKSLVVKLDQITTITGPSDRGKSAIIRALRWVCLNQPSGRGFIQDGREFSKVEIDIDDHTITRIKGKTNRYVLDGEDLKSFGQGVPDRVAEILRLGPENFQRQHDAPFWFADSAGEVSRKLNDIIDLGIIDDALTYANRQVRQSKAQREAAYNSLQTAREEKRNLGFVPELEGDWEQVNELRIRYRTQRDRTQLLASGLSAALVIADWLDVAGGRSREARTVLSTGKEWMRARTQARKLSDLLESWEDPPPREVLHDFDGRVRSLKMEHQQIQKRKTDLERLTQQLTQTDDALCQLRKRRQQAAKNIPKRCPTCGNEIGKI